MSTNHRTLIGGVGYEVVGGRTKIGGTAYNILNGRTKISGTAYNINFQKPANNVATARLYTDGSMRFQINDRTDANKTLKGSYTGFLTNTYNSSNRPWYSQRGNIKSVSFDNIIKPVNTAYWFYSCANLTSFSWDGLDLTNVKTMYGMFDYDTKLNANTPIKCGPNVTNFGWVYENCYLLKGAPVCGPNVVNFRGTYSNCYNLTGSPACGDKVKDMIDTYYNCYRLTGQPVIGPNVIKADGVYYNCTNLTGSIVVPSRLPSLHYIYYGCYKLTGSPVCSDNVGSMAGAYGFCRNLRGSYVCGNNVWTMAHTYQGCNKLTGDGIVGPKVTNAVYAYDQCPNLTVLGIQSTNLINAERMVQGHNTKKRLNIYAKYGTNTWNTLLCNNTSSIVGANITWTKTNNYYYHNATYNIYIIDNTYMTYTVDRAYLNGTTLEFINSQKDSYVAANSVAVNTAQHYGLGNVPWSKWANTVTALTFKREIVPVSTNKWFAGFTKLTGAWSGTIMSQNLTDMSYMFQGCKNFSIIPEIPGDVMYASSVYENTKVYGYPACGPSVIDFSSAYCNCRNLTGNPVCGDLVTDMSHTYDNCVNMTGAPVFGPNVVVADFAYHNCQNLRIAQPIDEYSFPTIEIGENVTSLNSTFKNCRNLFSNIEYYTHINIQSLNLTDAYHCFANTRKSSGKFDIIIQVPIYEITTIDCLLQANTYGLSSIQWYESEYAWSNSTYGIQVMYHM